jgi:hypothetical protein
MSSERKIELALNYKTDSEVAKQAIAKLGDIDGISCEAD